MAELLRTTVTEVGAEAGELIDGGVLILFAAGAPPELAEISVLHAPRGEPSAEPPRPGATLRIGALAATLTGVGPVAWAKVREIGHVVINFNGRAEPERPGELCATALDPAALRAALRPGCAIVIGG